MAPRCDLAGVVRRGVAVVAVAGVGVAAGCGTSDDASSDETVMTDPDVAGIVVTEPAPSTWCGNGLVPLVVAYDADDGQFRWVSCTDDLQYHGLLAVADGVVYAASFENGAAVDVTALDAATGDVVTDAPPPPGDETDDEPYTGEPTAVELDGVTIIGGQDDPTRAVFPDGTEGWSRPGVWAYDDVWAIDDDAVFAFEHETSRLVAYEIDTGEVRWGVEGDPYADGLWPWYAADGRLYTLWSNLQVRATTDGALVWRTGYPGGGMGAPGPRMSDVGTDRTNVFVAFTVQPSPGD